MCYYTDDNALSASGRDFHQVQKYLKQKFKILGTDSMMIIWSVILVNVNSRVLKKPLEVMYLPIMKSDFKKI